MKPEKISSFTDLSTWQKAKMFAVKVYGVTKKFPTDERFGLVSQVRRSSVSVSANIAEGFSRSTAKDKVYFYTIGIGSLTETLSHLYIANELGYITKEELNHIETKYAELSKMLNGMIKTAKGKYA